MWFTEDDEQIYLFHEGMVLFYEKITYEYTIVFEISNNWHSNVG